MSGELWNTNGAGHGETIFEQRPIEGFAVEGDQHGAVGQTRREFFQKRIFFVEIAEKQLFDLQAARIPPGEPDEKGVGAGTAGESGGFGVEEEPFFWIFESGAGAAAELFIARAREQFNSYGGRRREFRGRKPIANGKMIAETIAGDATAE